MVAILRTSEYRGDHSADVARVFLIAKGETVAQLMERLQPGEHDWIELRHAEKAPDEVQP